MAKKAKTAAKKAAAKKPKQRPTAAAKPGRKPVEAPAPRVASDRPMISENDLVRLLNKGGSVEKDLNELTGSWREEIGNAVAKKHLNKWAFALVRRMKKWSAEKLLANLEDFDAYLDMSGLTALADSVQRLPMADGLKQAEDDDADEGGGAANGAGEAPPTAPEAGPVSRPRLVAGSDA